MVAHRVGVGKSERNWIQIHTIPTWVVSTGWNIKMELFTILINVFFDALTCSRSRLGGLHNFRPLERRVKDCLY